MFLPVPDDYRTILNATRYTVLVTVTTDTRDGEPILIFTVFINNMYFQIPRAVIFQIKTNTNASFTFEDGEESDLLIVDANDPNFDPDTVPLIKLRKQIFYRSAVPLQALAGEYEGELTVIVVAREMAPQEQTSELQIIFPRMLLALNPQITFAVLYYWLHWGVRPLSGM